MYELSEREFLYISRRVYDFAKINLTDKKKALIVSRLSKRIRALKLNTFADYIEFLENESDNKEFLQMVDALTTNFSHFFREPHHFDFLRDTILPDTGSKGINIWSAASSTGQEVYSILMTIKEYEAAEKKKINYHLYASDISREVLQKAASGIYKMDDIKKLPQDIVKKYCLRSRDNMRVMIKKDLIKEINFFLLNLNDNEFNLPEMDVIFLRNAIIYFDFDTKVELMKKLYSSIKPGGYLILGHSESLSGISDQYELIGKTIYRRKG